MFSTTANGRGARRHCGSVERRYDVHTIHTHTGRKGAMNVNNRALKIVVCGPVKGGKTSIANFIAGQAEQLGNPNKIHEATVGVR